MAYTNIDDPSAHFQTALWSGNAGTQDITNDGNSDLKPDFTWTKPRGIAFGHKLMDSSRGIGASGKFLFSDGTNAESAIDDYMMTFNTDGFSVGAGDAGFNASNDTYVTWQWKAGGGTTATNNDGSIATTTQVNSDAGFSLVTWAGGGTGSLGHGLGVVPDMWIVKNRDYAVSWAVGFSDSSFLGGTSNYLSLNTTGAIATYNNLWGSSPANSSTITMAGDRSVNISGNDYVAYFFKAKQGYSKFGKYVGNGSANGPFVYTGFKPAFLMIKRTDSTSNWQMKDSARNPSNLADKTLFANVTQSEYSTFYFYDLLSNGFKVRGTDAELNDSGGSYIYMAFAENPFVTSTGIPTTAR